ncbi:aspartyl-phosphate phosphatase Spo0E family protein [Haloimpatiens sp. FM7330]|uniref:aspartyl-phosphate phosphatase Spo0E family protein n=1 Tax=Haloimpatiens sp. FM7330 TaxID=3298610 RepID=UPI00363D1374
MNNFTELKDEIENTRTKLNKLIRENEGDISNEKIIKLSQLLDKLLVDYIRKNTFQYKYN